MKNVIIGTAGHIDHGKTTLIKALTGRETDTLAEEKKRGISINLGFTYFDLPSNKRAGIVDVPGHEKFIKNMLAGASGLDMVLLVVAADEGVMPQTVEHMDILTFLNIKKGMIVLTKSDTVEEDFRELVKEDIREKVKGTFLEDAEIIEVDSISKKGLDNLINKIDKMTDEIEDKNLDTPARLNIDRVFSIKGFGTVVTGTLIEGKISIDDDLVIYPKELKTKIRSIQVHGEGVETAYAGQRTAINISNVKVEEINRGDVLASPHSLEEAMMLDVRLSVVKHTDAGLKHWDRLRLYHGTREILCRAVPLEVEEIMPGESGLVQLRLEESIVAKKGDKFVVRRYSPMETIGGGIVIDTNPRKHKRFDTNIIEALKIKEKGELSDILEAYLKNNSRNYPNIKEIMSYSGESEDNINKSLEKLIGQDKVICINNMYMHINQYNALKEKAESELQAYHKKFRLREGMLKEEVRSKVESKFKTRDFDVLLDLFINDDLIKVNGNFVSLKKFNVVFNEKQTKIKNEIEKILNNAGLNNIYAIEDITNNKKEYEEVLESLIGNTVVRIEDSYLMSSKVYNDAKEKLIKYLEENKEITLGDYRDLVNSSRKNCMIILEDFDRNKITKRVENKRVLF
ncbi:selenocysteine-specific translation elongation factor [Paraclostridium bifermentans]|uniref:Selenocysteine-specific elongation factor n=3 Tax=Paraclostridium TaxID=1849822 RepID=A0A5P3XDP4_PARBF|nr:selenocysteine-specific translation elongation factor [Paraclostridium bifermentans]MCU9809329.1 selenocysteine-specific translation elongation factor [Paraclostridium sp. AKS46]MDV8110235.1 selenocysteine-specific translation elongation factor [Bacillus sp. BAU-SS-2023]EQK45398.1 selenocysteine-specific translation elongation factor [[Clostridium] bifermentans ATCC 19299] [Paraclostridium bifermentans ATCC 19299]MCE9674230.1 selenocysteine-specific translation elongation factor [Paraclostri